MLIAAHDALKSAAEGNGKSVIGKITDVDKKFGVAFDLLYHFVDDFSTLNPNIRNTRFTQLIDKRRIILESGLNIPYRALISDNFTKLCYMRRRKSYSSVEFP